MGAVRMTALKAQGDIRSLEKFSSSATYFIKDGLRPMLKIKVPREIPGARCLNDWILKSVTRCSYQADLCAGGLSVRNTITPAATKAAPTENDII